MCFLKLFGEFNYFFALFIFRRYVKAIVFRFQVLIPELNKTLSEAERRHETFHVAYKSVIILFETLEHLVDVGVLSFSRDDAAKQLIDSFRRMDQFLKNPSLKEFSDKVFPHCFTRFIYSHHVLSDSIVTENV